MSFKPTGHLEEHHITVARTRSKIFNATDRDTLNAAYDAHISAKGEFNLSNSDHTMINLIGTWARLNRIRLEMEEKYS